MQFDQQNNFTMEMAKKYEYYQMQVLHFESLLLRLIDQLESILDENDRTRLFQAMTALSNKASTAERSQLWIRTIIKRHVRTLRSNLERYYVLKTIQQSLLNLGTITDLYQDIIYQHHFRNGKIISFPKFRIVDPTTPQSEIDWEKVNGLDARESETNTGTFTPILSRIVNTLMVIGSTIVYGVHQICTSSNTIINSNVVPVSP